MCNQARECVATFCPCPASKTMEVGKVSILRGSRSRCPAAMLAIVVLALTSWGSPAVQLADSAPHRDTNLGDRTAFLDHGGGGELCSGIDFVPHAR